MSALRILFVGETWSGSSAKSMREALGSLDQTLLVDIGEDHYIPRGRSYVIRAANRILGYSYRKELSKDVAARVSEFRPDVLLVYKGGSLLAPAVENARRFGALTVNVFPDYSPHAYGSEFRKAIGCYDLVVSTKPFHPAEWARTYGYHNRCVFVPHGYDPAVHLWSDPPGPQDFDVVLAATWRPQYETLMQELATRIARGALKIGIIGHGWTQRSGLLPGEWVLAPPLVGRAYGEWLRRGRIVIAPVNTEVVVKGVRQPGDQDTTRTYELAAAGCFFLHRRTPFAQTIYDEQSEVPMWNDPEELTSLIQKFLPLEGERRSMAFKAHSRAVPAYSIPNRAVEVLDHVKAALQSRKRET